MRETNNNTTLDYVTSYQWNMNGVRSTVRDKSNVMKEINDQFRDKRPTQITTVNNFATIGAVRETDNSPLARELAKISKEQPKKNQRHKFALDFAPTKPVQHALMTERK